MAVQTIGVVGAGTMGRGIAQAFAQNGFSVVFYARREAGVREGYDYIVSILASLVKKGKLTEEKRNETLDRIRITTNLEDLKDVDLIVESVAETLSVKQEMMRKLEGICRKDTVFATNTSSISISAIASSIAAPERVCGMHFFYPPAMMPVIEIAVARKTAPETVRTVQDIVTSIHKTAIEVQEAPGFVFNRLVIPQINEAAYLLMEGVATRENIDSMLKLAASYPIGPLALGDIIGLDVCLSIMEVLQKELGEDKYRPCPLLRRMVYANELGRKTGKGFYEYDSRK
ncbi:3-hydroxybutyryl-CoA dehydrogenase [Caproiciproducens sp. NJN-50]|uniref:3-hydroxyacyl-CoA dehydrogenase family protein n=1 Tax=Acutalibacteraceae TaxID=3082771 RepID=UPI000FFE2F86|nr:MULTISPECIES: 3-hydroxyacyl-CoA dehydrogenase NAD-binding domain-containing protein [Acutalibacteraceae]QAT50075.1 3-hydroxybutyryl-CoA dehydrogenase [Caproiciproducens sp. NJN-50]